jgi:hypothetical protein
MRWYDDFAELHTAPKRMAHGTMPHSDLTGRFVAPWGAVANLVERGN